MLSLKGAKGINGFSHRLTKGYLPQESSIEYEGLFYDYYFETAHKTEKLFRPTFTYAASKDPLNGKKEHYISIGLASCMDGEGFYKFGGRPLLNLVIVLDISGSMGSGFDGDGSNKTKLDAAKETLLSLLDRLKPTDRFGLVLFNMGATVVQPLESLKSINVTNLKTKIMEIKQTGGTVLSAGVKSASEEYYKLLAKLKESKQSEKNENRMIFLTDMQPSHKDRDGKYLFDTAKSNADLHRIYTTFIGIGVDFDSDLVGIISSIRANNYMSVDSVRSFKKNMDEEFDYLVTPNVFDCSVTFVKDQDTPLEVERVYGSPGNEVPTSGQLVFIESSFPSTQESENMTKGGIILAKIKQTEEDADLTDKKITFKVNYKDRDDKVYEDVYHFKFPEKESVSEEDYYENLSIRKAILLVRYVNFMKNFLRDQANGKKKPSMNSESGILIPKLIEKGSQNDKMVVRNNLNEEWKDVFNKFVAHFEKEYSAIQDEKLDRELKQILDFLKDKE